jgi:ubiquinone/menaquinone biosynthesis C-methylase UbiE
VSDTGAPGSRSLGPDDASLLRPNDVACVSVEEGYARWAQTYDSTPNPLLALEERYLTPLLPDLSGKHALDLACGTGRWLVRLFAGGASAGVGVDSSEAMLRVAGGKSSISGRLALADCHELPFRAAAFDIALCSFAINHIRDLNALAHDLARIMKCNAPFFLCEQHPEAYLRGWRPGFRDVQGAVQIETVHHPAENVVECFRSHCFVCLKLHTLFFGEEERPIFLAMGKAGIFAAASRVPAIQIYELRKSDFVTAPPGTTRGL